MFIFFIIVECIYICIYKVNIFFFFRKIKFLLMKFRKEKKNFLLVFILVFELNYLRIYNGGILVFSLCFYDVEFCIIFYIV